MNPPLLVFIVDQSGDPAIAAALPRIVAALGRQVSEHVAPTWGRVVPALQFGGAAPDGASQIVIRGGAAPEGELGDHDEDAQGDPRGQVFPKPILDSGGSILLGANSLSVTLSHELLELIGDASANLWADGPDGYSYALELCDAVEGDAYDIDGVWVSNFVFPGFFDPLGAAGVRLDYMRQLSKPFGMTPGGYQIRRASSGGVSNVWGDRFPAWKRAAKLRKTAFRAARAGARLAVGEDGTLVG